MDGSVQELLHDIRRRGSFGGTFHLPVRRRCRADVGGADPGGSPTSLYCAFASARKFRGRNDLVALIDQPVRVGSLNDGIVVLFWAVRHWLRYCADVLAPTRIRPGASGRT